MNIKFIKSARHPEFELHFIQLCQVHIWGVVELVILLARISWFGSIQGNRFEELKIWLFAEVYALDKRGWFAEAQPE